MSERPGSPLVSRRLSEPRIRIVCGSPPSTSASWSRSDGERVVVAEALGDVGQVDEQADRGRGGHRDTIISEAARKRAQRRFARGGLPPSSAPPRRLVGGRRDQRLRLRASGSAEAAGGADAPGFFAGPGAQPGERRLLGLRLVGERDRLGLDRLVRGRLGLAAESGSSASSSPSCSSSSPGSSTSARRRPDPGPRRRAPRGSGSASSSSSPSARPRPRARRRSRARPVRRARRRGRARSRRTPR